MTTAEPFTRADDEIAEELRVIAADVRRLTQVDCDALNDAARYIDWQNSELVKLRETVCELEQHRHAQLDRVKELRRMQPVTFNLFPAIIGAGRYTATFGYGVRK